MSIKYMSSLSAVGAVLLLAACAQRPSSPLPVAVTPLQPRTAKQAPRTVPGLLHLSVSGAVTAAMWPLCDSSGQHRAHAAKGCDTRAACGVVVRQDAEGQSGSQDCPGGRPLGKVPLHTGRPSPVPINPKVPQ